MPHSPNAPGFRTQPIAAALVAVFGVMPLDCMAVQTVGNCADDGDGSLRKALSLAGEGELVDATGLSVICSKISLTSNPLIVANNAQKINGPGRDKLVIDGAGIHGAPVFFHNGSGTLELDNLTVTNGYKYRNAAPTSGGCINSSGSVKLDHATVSNCTMRAASNLFAKGGAIYAAVDLTVTDSIVTGSKAIGSLPYVENTYGGGLFANGQMTITRSTISNNQATSGGGVYSPGNAKIYYSTVSGNDGQSGGGISCFCGLELKGSTISGNSAEFSAGLRVFTAKVTQADPSFIANSTITGNISTSSAGASIEIYQPMTISNSTIAFNQGPPSLFTAALYAYGPSIELESTIVAENYPADFDVEEGTTTVSGANNLIMLALHSVPGATISSCPRLEPLANTGGPTSTLAIKHDSPAINTGNNLIPLITDQRGTFARAYGVSADIGAWEWQGGADNNIFHDGFNPAPGSCL